MLLRAVQGWHRPTLCVTVRYMSASPARENLSRLMDQRRVELDLRWEQVADAAGLSYETLRAIRADHTRGLRTSTKEAVERALRWQRGSVDTILDGGEPIDRPELELVQGGAEQTALLAAQLLAVYETRGLRPYMQRYYEYLDRYGDQFMDSVDGEYRRLADTLASRRAQ